MMIKNDISWTKVQNFKMQTHLQDIVRLMVTNYSAVPKEQINISNKTTRNRW